MKHRFDKISAILIVAGFLMAACSSGDSNNKADTSSAESTSQTTNGLTEFEMKHGIGPITEEVTLEDIDMSKAEEGEKIFKMKCSACHRIGERYVGPALGNVLDERTPTYVLNMILNPDEMVQKHPEAKKMLQEYLSPMPNQNLEQEQARAIVAYLASVEQK